MPDANEIDINKMKCTCPTPAPTPEAQRHLYSTDWRRGLASGVTQILGLASGVTPKYTNMLVYFALGNAKIWRRVHCPWPTPDARYFASQWNIGFRGLEIFNKMNTFLSIQSLCFSRFGDPRIDAICDSFRLF